MTSIHTGIYSSRFLRRSASGPIAAQGKAGEQAVAIQALWAGGAESLKMTFLGRAALLGQFQHPNILRLEGVVTKSRPVMVLTELMELGPLDSFLRVSSALVKEAGLGLRKA